MFNVRTNFDQVAKELLSVGDKQATYAAAVTLTRLAQQGRTDLVAVMRTSLDKPTPWMLRQTFVKAANKQSLRSAFGIRGFGGLTDPAERLAHLFAGGARAQKGMEYWLMRAGYISSGERVVPGAGARINQYGNMSPGQVQQILSQLRAGLDASTYSSKSARSRRNVKRAGRIFWSRGGHLPRGAWIDQGGHVGVRPLLVVVSAATYRKLIDMEDLGQKVIDHHLAREWKSAWESAKRSAR